MSDCSADLDAEIRRLRIRIIGLTTRQLDEAVDGAVEAADDLDPGSDRADPPRPRREIISEALTDFSALASGGRAVPVLGDQSLADQVVVLLEHGVAAASALPPDERDLLLSRLLRAATGLRRALA